MRLILQLATVIEPSSSLHLWLWKGLRGVSLPFYMKGWGPVFPTSTLRNQDLFLFNTFSHRNLRVSSWVMMYYLASFRSGRQCLAYNSTRKPRGVFSLSLSPLFQVLPFAAQTFQFLDLGIIWDMAYRSQTHLAPRHFITTATEKGDFIKLKRAFISPIEIMSKNPKTKPFWLPGSGLSLHEFSQTTPSSCCSTKLLFDSSKLSCLTSNLRHLSHHSSIWDKLHFA